MNGKFRSQPWWYLGMVLVATGLVFMPAVGYEFVSLDDNLNVYNNGYVTDPSLSNLTQLWQKPYLNLYIPLTYTLWALQAKLSATVSSVPGGLPDPHLFHTINILLHLLSTGVVFLIVRSLVKDPFSSAMGALVFAIHPVQVEPVVWVTGFKDVLCGFWSVLAIWQYINYVKSSGSNGRLMIHYGVATLCLLLALLSKPVAVVLPMVAGSIALLLLGRKPGALARDLLPWMLLCLPVILVTKYAQPGAQHLFNPSLWERALVVGDSITFYLGKLLLPLNLGADYGRTPQVALGQSSVYATSFFPYILAIVVACGGRERWLLAAAASFVAALSPVLGLVTFDLQNMSTVADRYLYLAILGPVIWLSHWLSFHKTKVFILFALALIFLLGVKSTAQVRTWRDSFSFYQHILAVNPRSWTAYGNLGHAMAEQNKPEEAIALYNKVLAFRPGSANAHVGLGNQYRALNRTEDAIAAYRKALEYEPNNALAYKNLGDTYLSLERKEEVIGPYRRAILLNPDLNEVHRNLIQTFLELNKVAEGIDFYREATRLHPDSVQLYIAMGLMYNAIDRKQEAIASYQRAIAIDPGYAGAYNDLGNIYSDQGDAKAAITSFLKAIAIDPSFALAYGNLARSYLTQHQYQEALRYADQARAMGFDDPELMQTLEAYR